MFFIYFLIFLWGWSGSKSTITAAILYQPWMIDDGDCEAISGMNEWDENQSTCRKPALVPPCPPQIPPDLIWD
jgi:hypothetical protein